MATTPRTGTKLESTASLGTIGMVDIRLWPLKFATNMVRPQSVCIVFSRSRVRVVEQAIFFVAQQPELDLDNDHQTLEPTACREARDFRLSPVDNIFLEWGLGK